MGNDIKGVGELGLANPRPGGRDSVRCPNCGTYDIKTDVCPKCNKSLAVEWRKLETESPYFDHPPQKHTPSPDWTFPDRIDKPQLDKVDNSFPSVVSRQVYSEMDDPEMIEIGDPEKEVTFEPMPMTEPMPQPAPAPVPVPQPEKAPAGMGMWGEPNEEDQYAAGLFA